MTAKITALTVDADANKDTQTHIFDLSASYAPEILEFWVHKHHIAKAEADSLKVRSLVNTWAFLSLARASFLTLETEEELTFSDFCFL